MQVKYIILYHVFLFPSIIYSHMMLFLHNEKTPFCEKSVFTVFLKISDLSQDYSSAFPCGTDLVINL